MHYLEIEITLFEQTTTYGIVITNAGVLRPEIRAWLWEQGIRHTIHITQRSYPIFASEHAEPPVLKFTTHYVGFHTIDEAFAFKMRWL